MSRSWPYWGGTLETSLATGEQTVHYDVRSAYPNLDRVDDHKLFAMMRRARRKARSVKDAGHVGTRAWYRSLRVWTSKQLGAHDIYSKVAADPRHARPANGRKVRRRGSL